jgi:hypothetical protein
MIELPIQNPGQIDILGRRTDGGVDLVIVVSGPLENTADHLEQVEAKVQNYICEITSPNFLEQFPRNDALRQILLVTEYAVDQAILASIDSLRRPAADARAVLKVVTPDYFSAEGDGGN